MGHMGDGYRGMGHTCVPLDPTLTPSQWWAEMVQVMCLNVKKMSNCQKDVKLSKRCQMSKIQIPRLWRRFTKKLNWHEVHRYWASILTSQMMVTKNPQNVHRKFFWAILMTFISDVKIDVNMCEPLMSIYFFVNLLHSPDVWLFDIWHLFDNLTFWHIT